MRILNIRFCNLNSLVGEWQIDLTDPAYLTEGLFAITGPTGAGKSTLLDAICLALYGRTPRQSNVSKSQNEVMSRQTGECFAEVEFETPQGRWRVHWSQHRSRKRPDGALQQPKQEIVEVATGKVLHTKIKEVAETIERLTGMDFDRFTRSMLLAQGGFAAFLQADPDARAPILEQITGTAIYSEISKAVHLRRGEEKQKLDQLRAEQSGLQLLDSESEQQLKLERDAVDKQVVAQQQGVVEHQKLMDWRAQLDREVQRAGELDQRQQALNAEREAFSASQSQLDQGLKAQALRTAYEPLQQRRRDLAQQRETLEGLQKQLPMLAEAARQEAAKAEQAQQGLQQAETALTDKQPLITQLREQDWKVAEQRKLVEQLKQALPRALLESPALDTEQLGAEIEATERELQELLADGGRDTLNTQLEQIRQRGELLAELKHWVEQSDTLNKAHTALENAQAELAAQQVLVSTELGQKQQRTEALQREQQDLLKLQRLAQQIASLEQQRHELEAGKPCPLCGSLEHPWRSDAPLELSEETARLQAVEKELGELSTGVKTLEIRLAELATQKLSHGQQIEQNRAQLASLESQINEALKPLGWSARPTAEQVKQAHGDAGERWQAVRNRIKQIDTLEARQKQQRETRERARKRTEYDRACIALRQHQEARAALSPEPDTEAWDRRLQGAVSRARKALEQARTAEQQSNQVLAQCQAQIGTEQARIERLSTEIGRLQAEFDNALSDSAFADEAAFKAALLPAEQVQRLQRDADSLKARENELNGLLRHNRDTRAGLEQQALTEQSHDQLDETMRQLKGDLDRLLEQRGSLQQQLERNEILRQQFGEHQRRIEVQQQELSRWEQLHELIGSADGKKFRNFAQGLTFELMVGHANRQLQKMSDRYLLVRDLDQPLELNVIDNYQAGEVRSTKNLSGGESFLISLALALGLSGMASRNVRVDSLFLDEGFGTLDEDALETALDTLAGLQQEGKLIGVISHVQALKERIATRIEVQPLSGGRSRIQGPGCSG
jgi:exonuclease SbcC